jgi:hypothetical protein
MKLPSLGIFVQFVGETAMHRRTLIDQWLSRNIRQHVGSSVTNMGWENKRADGPCHQYCAEQGEYCHKQLPKPEELAVGRSDGYEPNASYQQENPAKQEGKRSGRKIYF